MSSTPVKARKGISRSGVEAAPAPSLDSCDSTVHILRRARAGDLRAAELLLERIMPGVRRWACGRLPHYVRGDADTEDVLQDAVLSTLKGLKRFRHDTVGGLQAYLRTSVINRIRDLIRGSNRRGVQLEMVDEHVDGQASPAERALARERLDDFLDAMRQLKPADRQIIIWRVELGYSAEEIAARLGKSRAAAGMSVGRAMKRLADIMNTNRPVAG